MRGKGFLLGLALGLSALGGCETSRPQVIKPPPLPEDSKVPSVADERYRKPPRFPKGTLNSNGELRRERMMIEDASPASFTDNQP